ncbi:MAG: hypothetical protein PHR30_18345 [Gallionellaceae bacterium]|nr:hypothetical protein [Gallionellaceae bacterium]MDD5367299.1 hypothetical protein [Gallionellaceae bacterium]
MNSKLPSPARSHPRKRGPCSSFREGYFSSIHNHSAYALIERDKKAS